MRTPSPSDAVTTIPLVTAPFVILVLGHCLQALGYSSMPLLPVYLEHLNATRSEIGLIMSMGAIGGLLFRPLVAWGLDRVGRKPTLLTGTLLLTLGMASIGLVDQIGPMIYISRFIIGIGVGALFTGYFTFATDLIPDERRTEGIALFGISGLLPLAVNPFFGDIGFETSELRWFFPILSVLIALSFLALFALKEPEKPATQDTQPASLRSTLSSLVASPMRPVWLATAIFGGLVALFMTFATVTAEHRGVDRSGIIWLTYAAGAIGVRLFGARLPDRLKPTNMVAPAIALYSTAMLLTASSQSVTGFVIAGLFAGLGHGYCFPVLTSLVVSRSPAQVRGSALAAFTALWEVSALALTPLFGAIADHLSDSVMFTSSTLLALVGLSIWAFWEHIVTPRTPEHQTP